MKGGETTEPERVGVEARVEPQSRRKRRGFVRGRRFSAAAERKNREEHSEKQKGMRRVSRKKGNDGGWWRWRDGGEGRTGSTRRGKNINKEAGCSGRRRRTLTRGRSGRARAGGRGSIHSNSVVKATACPTARRYLWGGFWVASVAANVTADRVPPPPPRCPLFCSSSSSPPYRSATLCVDPAG